MNVDIKFELHIQNPKRYYESGDHVSGYVAVNFPEAVKIRGIDLRFLGQASVNWIEKKRSENDTRRVITKAFKNKETYFDTTLLLFGREEDDPGDDQFHPYGQRKYAFDFQFPFDIPSSFEGVHGEVCYTISGLLDIPWAPDKSFKRKIKLISPLDLNTIESTKDSVVARDEKILCCMCCKHGPITAEVSIAKVGYVPGEKILVNAHISNNSRRKITRTEVVLKQLIIYRSSVNKFKIVPKNLRTLVDEDDILKGGEFTWSDEPLLIPKSPPSFLPNCGIIDVRYELVFKVDIVGTAMDMEMPLEIIIGTVPLKGIFVLHKNRKNAGDAQTEGKEAPNEEQNEKADEKVDEKTKESNDVSGSQLRVQSSSSDVIESNEPNLPSTPLSTDTIDMGSKSSVDQDNQSSKRPQSSGNQSLPEPST